MTVCVMQTLILIGWNDCQREGIMAHNSLQVEGIMAQDVYGSYGMNVLGGICMYFVHIAHMTVVPLLRQCLYHL